jgi:erythromycin esterase-like protein
MLHRPAVIKQVLLLGVLLSFGLSHAAGTGFISRLAAAADPMQPESRGTARLLDAASEARVVLLGEASHGTHEFYVWRSRLSRELIASGQIAFVAIEGDSATLAALDRYVRQAPGAPVSARAGLANIIHWPSWVWANAELAEFAEWLRTFNDQRPFGNRVAIHGLDLYAIAGALDTLEGFYLRHIPPAAAPVRRLKALFAPFREHPGAYADAVLHTGRSLRAQALAIVNDLSDRYRASHPDYREQVFLALQNARAVAAGLGYLEALRGPPMVSTNLRRRHFGLTLNRLLLHYGPGARGIVWAHNTHVGDSRATAGHFIGELSLGQLSRQALGDRAVFIVGFGTGVGEVLAAQRWGGRCEIFPTPFPRSDSLEAAMLAAVTQDSVWLFSPGAPATRLLEHWRAHRAIGTTYDPARERTENYVPSRVAARYDAFVFVPRTRALQALDHPAGVPRCTPSEAE